MFAKINGTEIFFDVMGEKLDSRTPSMKEKPTIIALHGGLGFDHGYLRPGIDFLSMAFNIIYVDYRGHGRSSHVPIESITLEQIADDVAELVNYLGLRKAFFLGHSAGGFVAQILALRHPEIVQGLILVSTGTGHKFSHHELAGETVPTLKDRAPENVIAIAAKLFNPLSITDITDDAREKAHKDFLEQVGPYYLAPEHSWKFAANMSFTKPNSRIMDRFVAHILPFYDISGDVKKIVAPTLVISGKYDWVTTPIAAEFITKQIRNSHFVLFKNSGHMPFIEEPEVFIPLVHQFVTENSP